MRRVAGAAIGVVPSNGRPDAWASRWRTVLPDGPAGWSRASVPSSTATRHAWATSGLVTDASGADQPVSPAVATAPAASTTGAAAWGTGQPWRASRAVMAATLGAGGAGARPDAVRPTTEDGATRRNGFGPVRATVCRSGCRSP